MQRFYLLYNQGFKIVPQVGAEIFMVPWGHHKVIIDKFSSTPDKALFFVKKIIENGWSRGLLENFVDTDLFERQGNAFTNFNSKLPNPQSELAQEITKDPYNFDFISITIYLLTVIGIKS